MAGPRQRRRVQDGITILELMIVLATHRAS
jgi:hypothetical protein